MSQSPFMSLENSVNVEETQQVRGDCPIRIQKSSDYEGVFTFEFYPISEDSFQFIPSDPLYHFPMLNNVSLTSTELKPNVNSTNFTDTAHIDITNSLKLLHDASPFRRGDELFTKPVEEKMHNVTQNSMAGPFPVAIDLSAENKELSIELDQSSRVSLDPVDKNEISINTKEAILQLQREWAAGRQDERHLHSITPASSLQFSRQFSQSSIETSGFYARNSLFDGRSSLSSVPGISIVSGLEESSECELDIRLKASNKKGSIISRITEELGSMKEESISEDEENITTYCDEGVIPVNTPAFLCEGASKNIMHLSNPPQIFKLAPKKLSMDSMPFISMLQETMMLRTPQLPNIYSPIHRKLIMCYDEKSTRERLVEISGACTLCGFGTAPQIEFSNLLEGSVGFVPYSSQEILQCLMTSSILDLILSHKVVWLACGFEHCAAISNEGAVFTWGYGGSGALGHGNTSSLITPMMIEELIKYSCIYIECGAYHNAVLTTEGDVYVWGRGDVNQLGVPQGELSKDDMGWVALSPMKLECEEKFKGLGCGEAHTLLLDVNGCVWSSGWGEDGQLGVPKHILKRQVMSRKLNKIPNLRHIVKVSAGAVFSIALNELGQVLSWGNGDSGQLGLGNSILRSDKPRLVNALMDENVLDVICGESHVICVTNKGNCYAWGHGVAGRFHDGEKDLKDKFPPGSDLVCFVPKKLSELEITHRFLSSKVNSLSTKKFDFGNALMEKLMAIESERLLETSQEC